jgi:hypothetical protein
MQAKLSQRNRIIEILSDFKVHCLANEMFCKDDRSRISELRKLGYIFDETVGNCHDPNHRHSAGLKLRKLLNNPLNSDMPVKVAQEMPQGEPKTIGAKIFLNLYGTNALSLKQPVKQLNTLFGNYPLATRL